MARALGLDVSDAGVTGVGEGGKLLGPSPGLALVEGDRVSVGEAAQRKARLKPLYLASRFWERLDPAPLGRPFPQGLTHADLVHAHLASLWERAGSVDAVILAVPGVYGEEALGRLVGISEALGMPVRGLIDTAVAAASAGFPGDRLLVIDLHLHRACLTELRQGEQLVRERVATLDGFGIEDFHGLLARRIAEAFVQQARFDPLHSATNEQALHDRLPGWLDRLARDKPDRRLSLDASGREVEIEVLPAAVADWARPFCEAVAQEMSLLRRAGEATSVLLASRASAVPGLAERLASVRGVSVRILPAHAAAAGALRERHHLPEGPGLRFLTRVPRPDGEAGAATLEGGAIVRPATPSVGGPAGEESGPRPTHLLWGHRACRLTSEPLTVGTAPPTGGRGLALEGETAGISRVHCRLVENGGAIVLEDLSTWGTFVNDERVEGKAVVVAGDRVRLGSPGIELLLVASDEG